MPRQDTTCQHGAASDVKVGILGNFQSFVWPWAVGALDCSRLTVFERSATTCSQQWLHASTDHWSPHQRTLPLRQKRKEKKRQQATGTWRGLFSFGRAGCPGGTDLLDHPHRNRSEDGWMDGPMEWVP